MRLARMPNTVICKQCQRRFQGMPQQPAGFQPWTFWQYSSKGQLAGFPPSQLVDFNYFNGSLNDLTTFASKAAAATSCTSTCCSATSNDLYGSTRRYALCNCRQVWNDGTGDFRREQHCEPQLDPRGTGIEDNLKEEGYYGLCTWDRCLGL